MSSLHETPRGARVHIGLYGRRNAGKSSLINALTGHETAIVSEVAGTTTDPVYKSMEIQGLGPCVLIDTAGFDDEGAVGDKRVEKTEQALEKTDIALLLIAPEVAESGDLQLEQRWLERLKARKTPFFVLLNKADVRRSGLDTIADALSLSADQIRAVSAKTGEGVVELRESLLRLLPEDWDSKDLTGNLVAAGDVVLLVMPQDIQAPKGRLILPQVQTTRELLDKRCVIVSVTMDNFESALAALSYPPPLIITDSQVFGKVYEKKPPQSRLTSFSVLMAGYKGDMAEFLKGAKAINGLGPSSHVLIAEACTHAPLAEDIGREKIPAMLRQRFGATLDVDVCSGTDFPKNLQKYNLIIHCGACMFNRKYMLGRIARAREQGVAITNYGVALAELTGILDKIDTLSE